MKPQDGNNSHVSNTENFFGGNETGKPIKQETDNGIQEEMTTRGDANSGNSIPTITDTTTPIVLFVGPGSSGKSMILVSLAKYFYSKKSHDFLYFNSTLSKSRVSSVIEKASTFRSRNALLIFWGVLKLLFMPLLWME